MTMMQRRRKAPWRWPWAVLLLIAGCGVSSIQRRWGPAHLPELVPSADLMRVHFIDVGQGDATLFEFPCAAVLVDTGSENNEVFDGPRALREYLDAFFARRPDLDRTLALLVITHPHLDHTRGIGPVVLNPKNGIQVKNVLTNGQESSPGGTKQHWLHAWVRTHPEVGYHEVRSDQIPRGAGLTDRIIDPVRCQEIDPQILVLWGRVPADPGWGGDKWGKHFDDENNHSIVVRVDFGLSSVLVPGDLEQVALHDLMELHRGSSVLDVDVLRVSHHGSHTGTRSDFLRVTSPKVAVISMGPASREVEWSAWHFGHPREDVVRKLLAEVSMDRRPVQVPAAVAMKRFVTLRMERAIYATGWEGTVILEARKDGRIRVLSP